MKFINLILSAAAVTLLSTTAIAADDHKDHNHDDKKGGTHAHDVKSMYGGIVTEVKDINYELVAKPDSITLYVNDHGKPVETKGATASITLLSAANKAEVALAPAGENKLEAKGTFKIGAGTKAIAKVTLAGKPAQNVKFTLK